MPRRLRKLLGLSEVEDEYGNKAPKQTPTAVSVATAPFSAEYGAVVGGQTHSASSPAENTAGTHDDTLLSGRTGTLSQTTAVDKNPTRSLGQTCSYWERAAKQLEDEEPSVFAALQELRKESSRTSKDLPTEISQIIGHHRNTMENKQWSLPFKVRGREAKIRAQLDNVWKVLQTFNAVGSTLASLDPVHAGIPFAGVSFIVQGALNDSAQTTAAMEGLSRISPIVDRYLLMETIYLGVQDRRRHEVFERSLVDLYACILKYQIAAACHCKRRTFSRFLRNLPKLDDWAKMLNDIDKKDTDCKSVASVFDSLEQRRENSILQSIMQELDNRLGSLQSKMQREERETGRAENARILSWICDYIPGRDHQDVMVHKKIGTQYVHTGQWLLDHHEFLSWRFGEDQGLSTLWVTGSVGTGKTSLVSRVIEWHLQGFQPQIPDTYGATIQGHHVDQRIGQADPQYFGSVAYFYCVRQGQDQSGTDPAVISRSLVRQLAWSSDGSSISSSIRSFYDQWRYERPNSGRLSLEECCELLKGLVSSKSNTTIILDGLDECEKPFELLRALKTIAHSSTGQIKLFISGRLDVNPANVLIPRSAIDIQSQSTTTDMAIFLHAEVKQADRRLLNGNFPELEDRLIEVLRDRAQGMFRWAELQLAILLDEDTPFRLAEDVISKLDRLEEEVGLPNLDLVYDEIYQKNTRVGTRDRENVVKTFKFLLYSFVKWNIHDLATAISLDVKGELNLAIDASYLLDICSNFLDVDHSGNVQFAHLSVPEYLKGGRSAIVFSDMDAHAQIAEVCLAYVMSPSAQEIVKRKEVDRRQVLYQKQPGRKMMDNPPADPYYRGIYLNDPLSLHMYALQLCLEHCELASMGTRQEGTALCILFTTFMSVVEVNPAFLTWTQSSSIDAIYLPDVPQNWTAQKRCADCCTRRDQTRADPQHSFFAACAYGFTEILQDMMRLDVCFDVNGQNEAGASGISLASRYGHVRVVELLLAEGAELNFSRSRYGFTPLYGAVVGCHHSLVALLLSRGADASARCKRYYTYVKPSSMDGSAGDRVDEENEVYETLLHIIIRERASMDELKKSSIMSSLLEHGASIEAINSFSETALHTACLLNDPLAVSILLDHNASPGAQDCDGCTPLMYSVFERSPLVIFQLLLEKPSIADIVRCDNDGYSVLSRSISYLGCSDPDPTMLLLNTIDSRVARELGTQEGDEFAEFSDILKKIGCDVLINEGRLFEDIIEDVPSQRSMINRLQAIGEHIVMGNVSWCNPDLCDKLRKEGFHTWWTDLTDEEKENGADNDVDADVNDTNSKDDAADNDSVDDDDDTDSKFMRCRTL